MITLRACPACGQPATDADFEHRYEQVPPSGQGRLETRLVACRACGHAFSNPQPTWDEVAPFYGAGTMYEKHHGDKVFDFDKVEDLLSRRRQGDRFNHLPIITGGEYLDVGSGDGLLVASMARLGMNAHGVEPRGDAVAACRAVGLDVRQGTLEEARFRDASFDCMSMNHVLEHVPDPVALLTECRRVLKPGGELVVGVPNYRSLVFQWVGWDWLGIDPPRHLHQFHEGSLRKVAERAGLTASSIETESLLEFVEPELARLLRRRALVPMRLTLKTRLTRPLAAYLTKRGNATRRGEALIAHLVRAE
jgi:2-polyprenyl-3-methyl-5-hydroxy-6-metoxy-1,4-benzoquinol methylase